MGAVVCCSYTTPLTSLLCIVQAGTLRPVSQDNMLANPSFALFFIVFTYNRLYWLPMVIHGMWARAPRDGCPCTVLALGQLFDGYGPCNFLHVYWFTQILPDAGAACPLVAQEMCEATTKKTKRTNKIS